MKLYFLVSRIELTETGIALVASDESSVELYGKDVWELLKWMCQQVIELGKRKEIESDGVQPQIQKKGE